MMSLGFLNDLIILAALRS